MELRRRILDSIGSYLLPVFIIGGIAIAFAAYLARDVMRHRLVLSFEAHAEDVTSDRILSAILAKIPAPAVPLRERSYARPVNA